MRRRRYTSNLTQNPQPVLTIECQDHINNNCKNTRSQCLYSHGIIDPPYPNVILKIK